MAHQAPPTSPLHVEYLGTVPYAEMLQRQELRHAQVAAGTHPDTLFLLEHPRVVTLGRNASAQHVRHSAEKMAAHGLDYHVTSRGGDVTYHGPGQLIAYYILQLQAAEQDIKKYVYSLEEVCIRTAADFGIAAQRVAGLRGIWVGNDKLAAIGVRLSRWVTLHGFALNVSTCLEDFEWIVPCGLKDRGVVSCEKLLGRAPAMADVAHRVVHHSANIFSRQPQAAALPRKLL